MPSEFNMPPAEIAQRLTADQKMSVERLGTPTGLTPRQANMLTKARLQLAMSRLSEGMVDEVQVWLRDVAKINPAEGVRLYMELLEFTAPRLKSAAVSISADVSPGASRSLNTLTMEELQAELQNASGP